LIDSVAQSIAAEITESPALIMHQIKSRLAVDLAADTPSTHVLDANGNRCSTSIAELTKEFLENKEYSAIMKGSKASGGGAGAAQNRAGGAVSLSDFKDKTEESLFANKHPEQYKSMVEAQS
jgi:hypothetical protein